MKKLYIAANWKSHKSVSEARAWMDTFATKLVTIQEKLTGITVIICAPFSDLYLLKIMKEEHNLPVFLGAQDISPFPEGAFTGEESATMLKELVDWVIIGHSERRKYLNEEDYELYNETKRAKEGGIKVMYCVPDDQTHIPQDVDVVAYEPLWAIGTGETDSPDNANNTITNIKKQTNIEKVVYGGSIMPDNIKQFIDQPAIDGVLVGGASLDPETFYTLIERITS